MFLLFPIPTLPLFVKKKNIITLSSVSNIRTPITIKKKDTFFKYKIVRYKKKLFFNQMCCFFLLLLLIHKSRAPPLSSQNTSSLPLTRIFKHRHLFQWQLVVWRDEDAPRVARSQNQEGEEEALGHQTGHGHTFWSTYLNLCQK